MRGDGRGQQRKTTDDRWWVPDRNIGRKEEIKGGGGGREIKQHRVIRMERGRYRKIEEKKEDTMQPGMGHREKETKSVSEEQRCPASLTALSAVQLRSGPLQLSNIVILVIDHCFVAL